MKLLVRAHHGNAMKASAEMWAQGTLHDRTIGQCHDDQPKSNASKSVVLLPVPVLGNDLDRGLSNLTWVQGCFAGSGHRQQGDKEEGKRNTANFENRN